MADQKQPGDNRSSDTLSEMAFQLFSDRSSRGVRVATEALAITCFRDAAAFMDVAKRVRSGEPLTAEPEGPQLSDASAPNLKPKHPLNMVSKRFGDPKLTEVRAIHNRLLKDPTLETLSEYDWGKAEVSTAREVFPAYVGSTN